MIAQLIYIYFWHQKILHLFSFCWWPTDTLRKTIIYSKLFTKVSSNKREIRLKFCIIYQYLNYIVDSQSERVSSQYISLSVFALVCLNCKKFWMNMLKFFTCFNDSSRNRKKFEILRSCWKFARIKEKARIFKFSFSSTYKKNRQKPWFKAPCIEI
jgi:hypothetical protein